MKLSVKEAITALCSGASVEEVADSLQDSEIADDGARAVALKDVKKGDFVKRKSDSKKVYKKGDYDKTEKKFWLQDTDDISGGISMKGTATVYVGFTY